MSQSSHNRKVFSKSQVFDFSRAEPNYTGLGQQKCPALVGGGTTRANKTVGRKFLSKCSALSEVLVWARSFVPFTRAKKNNNSRDCLSYRQKPQKLWSYKNLSNIRPNRKRLSWCRLDRFRFESSWQLKTGVHQLSIFKRM